MTIEEAKNILINRGFVEINGDLVFDGNKWRNSIAVISKWLEQEPCDDWYDVPSDEMTLEQARQAVKDLRKKLAEYLEQNPCEDVPDTNVGDIISRQAVDELSKELVHTTRDKADFLCNFWEGLQKLPPVTPKEKTGYCKDCKWWKDNDGVYRRGVGAESKCPINRKEVYEGNGYCFLFEPQESEG